MSLRVHYTHAPGCQLGFSLQQQATGCRYDFATGRFLVLAAERTQPVEPLAEGKGLDAGLYAGIIADTPRETFADGDYLVIIHHLGTSEAIDTQLVTMIDGDDQPPAAETEGFDPLAAPLPPGGWPEGSAGRWLQDALKALYDGQRATDADAALIGRTLLGLPRAEHRAAGSVGEVLDAPISSRSTFDGQVVGAVARPVVVGEIAPMVVATLAQTLGTAASQALLGLTLTSSGGDGTPLSLADVLTVLLAAAAGRRGGMGTGVVTYLYPDGESVALQVREDRAGNRLDVKLYRKGEQPAGGTPALAPAAAAATATPA